MASVLKIQSYPQPLELIKRDTFVEKVIQESTEKLFELLGWSELPQSMKQAIYSDVTVFATELNLNFTSVLPEHKERKKRVCYWVNQYKAGHCTENTATEMLLN